MKKEERDSVEGSVYEKKKKEAQKKEESNVEWSVY